jgi:hypothetical protein
MSAQEGGGAARCPSCSQNAHDETVVAWDKARPWAKGLSWQTQGGRVKESPGSVTCIEIWCTFFIDKRLGKMRAEGRISGQQCTIS